MRVDLYNIFSLPLSSCSLTGRRKKNVYQKIWLLYFVCIMVLASKLLLKK